MLADGGELLYETGSVLKLENDSVVKKLISKHSNAEIKKINLLDEVSKLNFTRTNLGVQLFLHPNTTMDFITRRSYETKMKIIILGEVK